MVSNSMFCNLMARNNPFLTIKRTYQNSISKFENIKIFDRKDLDDFLMLMIASFLSSLWSSSSYIFFLFAPAEDTPEVWWIPLYYTLDTNSLAWFCIMVSISIFLYYYWLQVINFKIFEWYKIWKLVAFKITSLTAIL